MQASAIGPIPHYQPWKALGSVRDRGTILRSVRLAATCCANSLATATSLEWRLARSSNTRQAYTRHMRIGFKTSQTNVDWPTLRETWELGDTLEVFDSAWIFDHFVALGEDGGGSHEGMVLAGALAVITRRLQFSALVTAMLGNSGYSEERDFDSYQGSVSVSTALNRFMSVGADYAYYRYTYDEQILLDPGLPFQMNRQSIRAHVSFWAPLMNRTRRADASR